MLCSVGLGELLGGCCGGLASLLNKIATMLGRGYADYRYIQGVFNGFGLSFVYCVHSLALFE